MKKFALLSIGICLSVFLRAQLSTTVHSTAGNLYSLLTTNELYNTTSLTLTGEIDARDFVTMRDSMPMLAELDMINVNIIEYTGDKGTLRWPMTYPANQIPAEGLYDNLPSDKEINTIKLPISIDAIGEAAFTNNTKLANVVFNDKLSHIGHNAFNNCQSLTNISLNNNLLTIDYNAFSSCISLTEVQFPNSLKTINKDAFSGCTSINKIEIGPSIQYIGEGAFGNTNIEIIVDNNNPYFSSSNGVLFNKIKTELVQCTNYTTGKYIIPSSVKTIKSCAFQWSTLKCIELPSNLTLIEPYALSYCSNLDSIKSNASIAIDLSNSNGVFDGTDQTNCLLMVPYKTLIAYKNANQWQDFTNIIEATNGFKIDKSELSFKGTESSDTIFIEANVNWSVSSNQSWATVSPSFGTGNDTIIVTVAANNVSENRETVITISAANVSDQVVAISQEVAPALINCAPGTLCNLLTTEQKQNITKLTLTGEIDARDFRIMRDSIPNLVELDLSNASIMYYYGLDGTLYGSNNVYPENSIPETAFFKSSTWDFNSLLEKVVLPSNLINIKSQAFRHCPNLLEVNLYEGLEKIESEAFSECTSLANINLPQSLLSIEFRAFEGCTSLTQIIIGEFLSNYAVAAFGSTYVEFVVNPNNQHFSSVDGVLFNKDKTVLVQCTNFISTTYTIPSSVKSIYGWAFMGCVNITKIKIPESVTRIDDSGLYFANIRYLELPSSLNKIGSYAFARNFFLDSVIVQNKIPIDLSNTNGVFFGVNQTTCKLKVPYKCESAYRNAHQWQDFTNIIEATNGFKIDKSELSFNETGGNDTIFIEANVNWSVSSNQSWATVSPSSGTGNDTIIVTVAANNVSENRETVITVSAANVSDQVVAITQEATRAIIDCTPGNLCSLITAKQKQNITKLTLTGEIDARDFVTMRDSMPILAELDMTNVNIVAYSGILGTYSRTNNYSENTIPQYAFLNPNTMVGSKIEKLKLPVSTVHIDKYGISYCENLTDIVLHNNLKTIGESVFNYCLILPSISLPNSLEFIGDYAFMACYKLENLSIGPFVSTIGIHTFDNTPAFFNVDENNQFYSSLEGVLYNEDKSILMKCPSSKVGTLNLPSTVIEIANSAISRCTQLTSVILPEGLEKINSYSFFGCESLQTISIPNSNTIIDEGSFNNCLKLSAISFPPSIKHIGRNAFSNCLELKQINCESIFPIDLTTSPNVFYNVDHTNCQLIVPYGTANRYRNSNQWQDFAIIEEEATGYSYDKEKISFIGDGELKELNVVANTDWTISCDADWLSFNATSGNTDQVIQITAAPNTTFTSRYAEIMISAPGFSTNYINITQNKITNALITDRVNVSKTRTAPSIDGAIDAIWDDAQAIAISKDYINENPTIDAYWKALWDDNGIYVLVDIIDDDHWPSWESGGNFWEYDYTEVYFDINEELKDGVGGGISNSGHFMAIYPYWEEEYGQQNNLYTNGENFIGGTYAYALTGENIIKEYFFPYEYFYNKDGVQMNKAKMLAMDSIGFDVYVTDQDEGITTFRQRKVWQNNGVQDESYFNMDDCGTLKLIATPIADAGGDFITDEGRISGLCGGNSFSPRGTNLSYSWTGPNNVLINGTDIAFPLFTGPSVENDSVVFFTLTVFDGTEYSETDTVYVTILANTPPAANAGSDFTANEETQITLDGSLSSDLDNHHLIFSWTAPAGIRLSNEKAENPTFTAPDMPYDSILTFTLLVSDSVDTDVDEVRVLIKHINKVPVANAGTDQTVNEETLVILNGSLSADPDNDNITFSWVAPNGIKLSSTNEISPSFTAPDVYHDEVFTFQLTVNDGTTNSTADEVSVTVRQVNKAPTAYAGLDFTVDEATEVTLDGSGSHDPDYDILSYSWSAPDGITLSSNTDKKPTFTAPLVSTDTEFVFTLTVSDGQFTSSPAQVTVTVHNTNEIPVANAGEDFSVNEKTLVTLDGSASSDAENNPLTYKWTAPEGITLSADTDIKPTFTAPDVNKDSLLTFTLIVNDGNSNSDPSEVVVTILKINQIPVGNAGNNQTVNEGTTVTLDGTASADADKDKLTYEWSAPVGITLSSNAASQPTFVAPDVKTDTEYTFTLTVSDGDDTSEPINVTITVLKINNAPLADAGNEQTINEETEVTLNGTGSFDADNDALTYNWTAPKGISLSSTTSSNPSFMAPDVNEDTEFTFTLVVNDGEVNSQTDEVTITVIHVNKAPIANAGEDQTVVVGTKVKLSGKNSLDPEGEKISYLWTAPDGITLDTETDDEPKFTAPEVKENTEFVLYLVVNDGQLDSEADEVIITVTPNNQAPIADAGDDQTVDEETTVTLNGGNSYDADNDQLTFTWTSPSNIDLSSVTDINPTFVAPNVTHNTEFIFTLTVNDGIASSPVDEVTITVRHINKAPIANASEDQTVIEKTVLTLDASDSYDPDNDELTFLWTVPDVISISSNTDSKPSIQLPDVDADITADIILTVSDGLLQSSDTVTITILNTNTTGIRSLIDSEWKVYPNPTSSVLYFSIQDNVQTTNAYIEIYTVTGSKVVRFNLAENQNYIDISNLKRGVYYLNYIDNDKVLQKKITKE